MNLVYSLKNTALLFPLFKLTLAYFNIYFRVNNYILPRQNIFRNKCSFHIAILIFFVFIAIHTHLYNVATENKCAQLKEKAICEVQTLKMGVGERTRCRVPSPGFWLGFSGCHSQVLTLLFIRGRSDHL